MLKVTGLQKKYSVIPVLNGFNMQVSPGEIFGLIGKNGAGKTTALNIIAGLRSGDGGTVAIDGREVTRGMNLRGTVGYLAENPSFYPYLNPVEYLNLLGGTSGMSKNDIAARTAELLPLVGLQNERKKRLGGFSRGMQQRFGIAAAIFARPKLLLLDEPSSALDPTGRADISSLLTALRAQGLTIILSSHILNDLENICDRVGILNNGHMVIEGRVSALLAEYAPGDVMVKYSAAPSEGDMAVLTEAAGVQPKKDRNGLLFKTPETSKAIARIYAAAASLEAAPEGVWIVPATLDSIFERVAM